VADTTNGTWHVFCEDQVVMGAHIDGRVFTRRMWGRHFDLGNTENGCMDVLERGRCDIGAVVYFFDVDIFGNPPMDLRRFLPFPAFYSDIFFDLFMRMGLFDAMLCTTRTIDFDLLLDVHIGLGLRMLGRLGGKL